MNNMIFFHFRPREHETMVETPWGNRSVLLKENIQPHTYCVLKSEDNKVLTIGYSVVCKKDKFCRKKGREIAEKMVSILDKADIKNYICDYRETLFFHESINKTLDTVIDKSLILFKDNKIITIKIFSVSGRKTKMLTKFSLCRVRDNTDNVY